MNYNTTLIKKYENQIDETLSTVKEAAEKKGSFDAITVIQHLDKDIKEEDIESKFREIYFNIKTAFYNKGFIIRSWTHRINGKKIFDIRYRNSEDRPPVHLSDFKCRKLVIPNDVLKVMEETKNLTSQDGLEYGFYLLYGEDCRIFPAQMQTGSSDGVFSQLIPPEGYAILGFFHTHPGKDILEEDEDFRKILLKNNILIMPSPNDVFINISDFLTEKDFNHSIMMILSTLDSKGLMLIPKRNLPDTFYKSIFNILLKHMGEINLDHIFDNLVHELYQIIEFDSSFEGEIIIEYSNGEYRLE